MAELLDGSGAVRLPRLFSEAQVEAARDVILRETADHTLTGSHFNKDDEDAKLQRRVWNLLAKGEVFVDMVLHPSIVAVIQAFLGSDFVMGSICASRTMPGFRGQEPHIDSPYWDYYRNQSFPVRINALFPLNAQATIVIDPFTAQSGATAFRPGSQKALHYPGTADGFFEDYEQMIGDPGGLITPDHGVADPVDQDDQRDVQGDDAGGGEPGDVQRRAGDEPAIDEHGHRCRQLQ